MCGTDSYKHAAPELTWALLMALSRNLLSEAQFGINHGRRVGSAFVNVDLGMQPKNISIALNMAQSLLHGWGLNAEVWQSIIPRLSAHYRLHLLDLPGYGRSQGVHLDRGDDQEITQYDAVRALNVPRAPPAQTP